LRFLIPGYPRIGPLRANYYGPLGIFRGRERHSNTGSLKARS